MLTLKAAQRDVMVATCIRALPNEGCGLLLGTEDGVVSDIVASPNAAASARIYEIDSRILLQTYRRADVNGLAVIGVFHSHTHSEAYPSPTDIKQSPDPAWHYVLVSLRDLPTVVRSFQIVNNVVSEEDIVIG